MIQMQDDPTALLEAEHEAMRQLLAEYRSLCAQGATVERRKALAEQICTELAIHAHLEDELLYPLAREVLAQADLLDEAQEGHARARDLMCHILVADGESEHYDEKVSVLSSCVEAHMAQERDVLFPLLRQCGADLQMLGRRLRERRTELEAVPEALREEALVSMTA